MVENRPVDQSPGERLGVGAGFGVGERTEDRERFVETGAGFGRTTGVAERVGPRGNRPRKIRAATGSVCAGAEGGDRFVLGGDGFVVPAQFAQLDAQVGERAGERDGETVRIAGGEIAADGDAFLEEGESLFGTVLMAAKRSEGREGRRQVRLNAGIRRRKRAAKGKGFGKVRVRAVEPAGQPADDAAAVERVGQIGQGNAPRGPARFDGGSEKIFRFAEEADRFEQAADFKRERSAESGVPFRPDGGNGAFRGGEDGGVRPAARGRRIGGGQQGLDEVERSKRPTGFPIPVAAGGGSLDRNAGKDREEQRASTSHREEKRTAPAAERAGEGGGVREAVGGKRRRGATQDGAPCAWRPAAETGEGEHAERVDVRRWGEVAARKLLGSGIPGRAESDGAASFDRQRVGARKRLRFRRLLDESEIDQDGFAAGAEQDVGRFDVAVDEAQRMQMGQASAKVEQKAFDGARIARQVAGTEFFERKPGNTVLFSGRDETRKRRVGMFREQSGFAAESLCGRGVAAAWNLERDDGAVLRASRPADLGAPAPAEKTEDEEGAERRAVGENAGIKASGSAVAEPRIDCRRGNAHDLAEFGGREQRILADGRGVLRAGDLVEGRDERAESAEHAASHLIGGVSLDAEIAGDGGNVLALDGGPDEYLFGSFLDRLVGEELAQGNFEDGVAPNGFVAGGGLFVGAGRGRGRRFGGGAGVPRRFRRTAAQDHRRLVAENAGQVVVEGPLLARHIAVVWQCAQKCEERFLDQIVRFGGERRVAGGEKRLHHRPVARDELGPARRSRVGGQIAQQRLGCGRNVHGTGSIVAKSARERNSVFCEQDECRPRQSRGGILAE